MNSEWIDRAFAVYLVVLSVLLLVAPIQQKQEIYSENKLDALRLLKAVIWGLTIVAGIRLWR